MRYVLPILGILGGAIPALSQTALPTIEDSVVVTAALDREEREELPASVDVLEAEEIEARKAPAVADLLATVAGLTVVRSGAPGQSTSLFSRGTESDQTLVLWNGIELNDPFFGGFNWAFLPTEGVQRIEVARGPFSALYGSDALGGVIHVISGPVDGIALRLEGGERGSGRAALAAGTALGRARLDVTAHLGRFDGELENDAYDSGEIVTRVEWKIGPGLALGLVARASDSDTGIPLSGGLSSPEREIAWRERELALPFRAELESWKLDLRLSRVSYESAFRDPADPFGFTSTDTGSESLRARAVASRPLGERLRLSFGAEVERLEVDHRTVFGVDLAGDSQTTRALFGQLGYDLGRARLDLGLRRDDNDVFGGETSPKLGVSFDLAEWARGWAAYGRGFRAPSIGELFFPFSGNRELKPERSDSYELGFEARPGAWSLALTGFRNDISDLIDFDLATFRNLNVGRARTRGLEARAGWEAGPAALRWNATYLEAEDLDSGLPLLRRARRSSSLVVLLRRGDWSASATGIYMGERPDLDPATFARVTNPGYLRLDLALEWRGRKGISPYLRLENAADRRYAEALGFPAPGRTLILGLSLDSR